MDTILVVGEEVVLAVVKVSEATTTRTGSVLVVEEEVDLVVEVEMMATMM